MTYEDQREDGDNGGGGGSYDIRNGMQVANRGDNGWIPKYNKHFIH